jgi:hypothetical protein
MKNRLGREITCTLVLKALALALLWFVFFRAPADGKPDAAQAGAAIFGSPAQAPGLAAPPASGKAR